ncbi:MAG: hypothetical protein DRJ42_22920 [Deltaproteobacteria bacterium]|nr:MAG: hypothetical protein DRJ42_22920 [Deltaproteobacteria bacterium]
MARSFGIYALLVSALVVTGCSADNDRPTGVPDGDTGLMDSGFIGATQDSSAALDAALDGPWTSVPEEPGSPLLARNSDGLDEDAEPSLDGRAECYAEGDGSLGCDDGSCFDVRSCCVDDGACCAAVPRPALERAFTTTSCATNNSIADCAPGVVGFGSPSSFAYGAEGDDIAPGGDLGGIAGVLTTERVDLVLHRLRLTATFVPPTSCEGACAESVALGVTEQTTIPGPVRPVAALVYSASRQRMALLIGDTPVKQWDDVIAPEEWVLDLRPDGTAAVHRGTEALPFEAQYRPRASVSAVLWGRTINPAIRLPTRLRGVTAAVSLCDVAAGWRDRAPLTVTLDGGAALQAEDVASAPSVAGDVLAFELGGAIYLAQRGTPGGLFQTMSGVALEADSSAGFMGGGVADPELIENGTGYSLYFTAITTDGATSIGRVVLDSDLDRSAVPVMVLAPSTLSADEVREPTVHVHETTGGLVMAVRASDSATEWLALARSSAGATFTIHRSPKLATLSRHGGEGAISRFDQDEASHPSLTIHNGAWKLHYTGRRGTRESIGLLVSDDLVHWRSLGEVFPAGSAPFEAVGVREADVATTDTGLSMVYVGTNGVFPTLAGTTRIATDVGQR